MPEKRNNFYYIVVIACYALVVVSAYMRVYVSHAYPTYYREEDKPSLTGEFYTVFSHLAL
jgi:hypothetical protein